MIKRSGVEVMNARTKGVSIAKETIEVCKNKQYTSLNGNIVDISGPLDAAIQGTVLYKTDSELPDTDWYRKDPRIQVTNETTAQAALRLEAHGKTNIVALNFASARNQGGGFLSGAMAQEEDLCRASGLYPCLKSKPVFYNENILCDDCYYTNNIIYSPNVPFFRDENNLFLENPFTLSIITSPAPNLNGAQNVDKKKVAEILASRMDRILSVAASHGHLTLILGAWGCGAFGNDPADVAELFKSALIVLPAFEHVCFAVRDNNTPPHKFEAFTNVFK
jgi:uncharacterized protein (TIGR02452 family)